LVSRQGAYGSARHPGGQAEFRECIFNADREAVERQGGTDMSVLSTVKFTALRMVRNYIVLLLLLVVPIFLITFFSFILSGHVTEAGVPYIYQNALTLILVFQLFGGSIVMYLIHHDLFAENRMRMYALPINPTMYAFSIMACGAVYSIALGV